jgi:hypothetical protein
MSRTKVKKVKIPLGGKDGDISEMFNSMLGAGNLNLSIVYPKYLRIKILSEQLIKLFNMLEKSPFMRVYTEFEPQKKEIAAFCEQSTISIAEVFSVDLTDNIYDLNTVEEELKKSFTESYESMKKCKLINTFIVMCDRLVVYKKYFIDLEKLNHRFITSMPGAEWMPFPFTNLNLKHIFSLDGIGENNVRFFMTVLNKAFELSHALWSETGSPDIDVDQFVEVIMSQIGEIQQKVPELNRCKKAFAKIKDSVSLLKNRFNGYYRDFVETKDSTIMMQHFIIDVSTESKPDPETTRQFREIIKYYRKMADQQISNPKVKMLFDKVNESFKELEKGTSNLVNVRSGKTEVVEPEEDSEPITVSKPTALTANDIELGVMEEPVDKPTAVHAPKAKQPAKAPAKSTKAPTKAKAPSTKQPAKKNNKKKTTPGRVH